ncbi:HNH endonuclease [Sphingobium sp. WCS2017Hpa-17]|uniref:HNH endonuclease n=1 Tax=Sphingobium sp. WCS2017Hpa-17 TaxID=3073638 RepID=UPI00288C262A|nr:HNH endonuclease [Sphingobium sp. WCS2017Hpa-17]
MSMVWTILPTDAPDRCWLCERPLGRRVEWHHPLPRSRGGRAVVPLHPICHRTIHATLSNAELACAYADAPALRAQPGIARFLAWVADKPADFHAPTRRRR